MDHTASVGFDAFHAALAADGTNRALAAAAARGLGPFAYALPDGRAVTFWPAGDRIDIRPGTDGAATVMRIDEAAWRSFADERYTRYGLLFYVQPTFERGEFADLAHWEPALRALFHGRAVFDPAADLLDRDGRPLDLGRSFSLDDDPAELAHFLRTAGFVHVRAVLDGAEVAALGAEVDRLVAAARPGDKARSWWTRDTDGRAVVCQLKYGAVGSGPITDLHRDPRLLALVAASGEDVIANLDRNEGTKIIIKHPGATEGQTDLPLHTDCGMGFHPIACQMVLIGVQLERGNARGGQIQFLAGSHTSSVPDPAFSDRAGWPLVSVDTEPGDCTVHFSHLMHGAPAPSGGLGDGERPRRTVYACYAPRSLFDAVDPFSDLVADMVGDDGVTATVDDVMGRSA